jgi:Ca2+-binding RTX toxin-like protein
MTQPERKTMKKLIRPKESQTVRLAASALAAVVAAGVVAGAGNAAPAIKAGKALHSTKSERLKEPTLENGVLTVEGTNAGDRIALRLQAGQPDILQVDLGDDGSADFSFERADVAEVIVQAGNGDDFVRIDEANGVFGDSIPTTIDGGNGNDELLGGVGAETLLGGNGDDKLVGAGAGTLSGDNGDDTLAGGPGAETLLGGNGDDSIDGNKGNDVAFMGNGDDTFVWDPGDGSDTVEGQNGSDTMRFNGANADEQVDLTANGNRLRFFRDVARITMDTDSVERVDFNALGGADVVTVNDLSGTDVTDVNIDLASTLGGSSGDGQPDRVIVNATTSNDTINVSGNGDGVNVSGLAATVRVLHSEAANDRLEINTLAGTDTVDPGGLSAGVIQLFEDGVLVP